MKRLGMFLITCISLGCVVGSMDSAKREGEALARSQKATHGLQPTTRQTPDEVLPTADRGKTFHSAIARADVLLKRTPETVADSMNPKTPYDLRPDDSMFAAGDRVTDNPETILNATVTHVETDAEYSNTTCRESGKPYPITVVRDLWVEVKHTPKIEKRVKVCDGHERKSSEYWESNAISWVSARTKELTQDPTVHRYEVDRSTGKWGWFEDYQVWARWWHKDDTPGCDHAHTELRVIQEETWEETGEEWVADDLATYMKGRGPECRLTHREVLIGPEARIINGKPVSRDSWKDKQTYHCQYPSVKGCEALRAAKCEEQSQACVQWGVGDTCALWEKTFRCKTKSGRMRTIASSRDSLYCLDGNCIDTSYADNQQFGEVMTNLSIFNDIKKELHDHHQLDARTAKVFGGEPLKCHKNVLETIMYDCCGSLDGFTTAIGLSRCDAEERTLSERKKAGHCHYVGSKSESFLFWKSRDVHSYCCFPSKFMRVLQEKAREQLGKSWGWGGSPNCEGLTMAEIGRLRFDVMDLSEAYEEQLKTLKERTQEDVSRQFRDDRVIKAKLERRMRSLQGDTRR
jgi:conjugal transfer mating pair stabilization protein TraN